MSTSHQHGRDASGQTPSPRGGSGSGQDLLASAAKASPPSPAPGGPQVEDAATQALSEALSSSFKIIRVVMALLLVAFLSSGVFTVDPNELAVVLRFGRPVGVGTEQLLKPGLHWAFPAPIDEIVRVPVAQIHTVTSTAGWYASEFETVPGTPPSQGLPYLRPGVDGYTLTGEGAVIHARATLKYRVRPAGVLAYLFEYGNVTNLLQHVLDNALIYASARTTAEAAITYNQVGFREGVRNRVNQLLDKLQLGLVIEAEEVQTSAPLDLRRQFDAVVEAQQTANTEVSRAEVYARSVTNNAFAQAAVTLNDGVTRSNEMVKVLAADAKRFSNQLPNYLDNPALFRQRVMAETMEKVLTNSQLKLILPKLGEGQQRELRLLLGREQEAPKPPAPGQP